MCAFRLFRDAVVINPAKPMASDFMTVLKRALYHRRMAFGGHRNGEDSQWNLAVSEKIENAPHSRTRTIFVNGFHGHVAGTIEWRRADDLREKRFGPRVAMKDTVLSAFFVVEDKLDSETRASGPVCPGWRATISDHVARIRHRPLFPIFPS